MAEISVAILEVTSLLEVGGLSAIEDLKVEVTDTGAVTVFDNFYFKGNGKISGTTEVDGFPDVPIENRRVVLLDQLTMIAIASMRSGAGGEWEFQWLDETRRYVVVAFYDAAPTFRAVIADGVEPELM